MLMRLITFILSSTVAMSLVSPGVLGAQQQTLAPDNTAALAATLDAGAPAAIPADKGDEEGPDLTSPCADGVVKDDGSVETGWGWVPSAVEGIYAQSFHTSELESREIDEVCVCFIRTREDASINFEVVFYKSFDLEGYGPIPLEEPFAAFPATLDDVPQGVVGAFAKVPTPGVKLPPGPFYVGVRWDPSADDFFFVCADTTEKTERVEVFFKDDRALGWSSTEVTADYIFDPHRAIMVRPVSAPLVPVVEVPSLKNAGLLVFAFLLGTVAVLRAFRGNS